MQIAVKLLTEQSPIQLSLKVFLSLFSLNSIKKQSCDPSFNKPGPHGSAQSCFEWSRYKREYRKKKVLLHNLGGAVAKWSEALL